MLKMLVFVLLLANGAYFAWGHGWLAAYGVVPERVAQPERLAQQIRPEVMQLTPESRPAEMSTTEVRTTRGPATTQAPITPPAALPLSATQCLQVGPFTERQARALRLRLRNSLPADSWSFETSGDSARWIIYMGKYISKEAVNRKRAKLEQLGLAFEPPISPLLNPGLSLGSFGTKADAEDVLAQMEQRGLRSAKVILERPELPSLWLRLPAVDLPTRAKLDALKPSLLDKPVQACQ